jgi:hypothetical protein
VADALGVLEEFVDVLVGPGGAQQLLRDRLEYLGAVRRPHPHLEKAHRNEECRQLAPAVDGHQLAVVHPPLLDAGVVELDDGVGAGLAEYVVPLAPLDAADFFWGEVRLVQRVEVVGVGRRHAVSVRVCGFARHAAVAGRVGPVPLACEFFLRHEMKPLGARNTEPEPEQPTRTKSQNN